MAVGTYKVEAGGAYREYMDAKDATGAPLYTKEEALNHARRVGAVNAAIEVGGFHLFLKGAKTLWGTNLIKTILSDTKAREMIIEAGQKGLRKRALKNVAVGTIQMATPEIAEEGAQTFVSDMDEKLFGKRKYSAGKIVDDVAEAMFEAVPASIGLAFPGVGIGSLRMNRQIKRMAKQINKDETGLVREKLKRESEDTMIKEILKARNESKYHKTAPESYREILQEQLKQNGKENIYIDVASASETEEGRNAISELIENKVITKEEATEAITEGTPLQIKAGMYMQTVTEETADTLSLHSTFDEEGKTLHDINKAIEQLKEKRGLYQEEKEKREMEVAEELLQDETLSDRQKFALTQILAEGFHGIEEGYKKIKEDARKTYGNLINVDHYLSYEPQGVDWVASYPMSMNYQTGKMEADGPHMDRVIRQTNNEKWYSDAWKRYGRKPHKRELYDIADEEAVREITEHMKTIEDDIKKTTNEEERETLKQDLEEGKQYLEAIKEARETYEALENLESYIEKLDKEDIRTRTQMSEEAYQKAYKPALEALKKAPTKAARVAKESAFIYAKMVDNFARRYHLPVENIVAIIQNSTEREEDRNEYGQAMYRSKENTLSGFVEKVMKEPEVIGKAYYRVGSGENTIDISYSAVQHIQNGDHPLTTAQWEDFANNIGNISEAYKSKRSNSKEETSVLIKIKTPNNTFGVVLKFTQSGRVFLTTAFANTEKGIDAWIQQNKSSRGHPAYTPGSSGQLLENSQTLQNRSSGKAGGFSISTIQKELGIVKMNLNQRLAPHEVDSFTMDELETTATITGDEFGEYEDIKDLRKKALDYYKKELQGTYVHNKLLGDIRINEEALTTEGETGDIRFTGKGKKEMVHTTGNLVKLLIVKELKNIIKNARIIGKGINAKEKHEGWEFYYIHSAIETPEGKQYVVVTVADKGKGVVDYYNHNVFTEKEYKNIEKATVETSGKGFSRTPKKPQTVTLSAPIIYEAEKIYKWEKTYNQKAYHGSPYTFDRFDLGAIGTGEGGQAHGWGLYFTKDRKVAANYRILKDHNMNYKGKPIGELRNDLESKKDWDKLAIVDDFINEQDLSRMDMSDYEEDAVDWFKKEIYPNVERQSSLLEVDIPDNEYLLNEDAPLSKQSQKVKEGIVEYYKSRPDDYIAISADELGDVTGDLFYKEVVYQMKREGSSTPEKDASLLLNKLGIKGLAYHGGRDGQCFVVFDDKAIKIINRYNQTVNRNTASEAKLAQNETTFAGAYNRLDNVIHLFEAANESTVIHEAAHWWLSTLENIVNDSETRKMAEGNEPLQEALQKMQKDLLDIQLWGWDSPLVMEEYKGTVLEKEFKEYEDAILRNPNDKEAKERFIQERFARAFERYLMTGKAPTKELRSIFRAFKQWLIDIYKATKAIAKNPENALGLKEPPEEIQKIFDHMVATDEEIESWAAEKRLDTMYDANIDYNETEKINIQRWAEEIKELAKEDAIKATIESMKQEYVDYFEQNTLPLMVEDFKKRLLSYPPYKLEALKNNHIFTDKKMWEEALEHHGYTEESYEEALKSLGGPMEERVKDYIKEQREKMESDLRNSIDCRRLAEGELESPEGKRRLAELEQIAMKRQLKKYARIAAASLIELGQEGNQKKITEEELYKIKERNGLLTKEEKEAHDAKIKREKEKKEKKEKKEEATAVQEEAIHKAIIEAVEDMTDEDIPKEPFPQDLHKELSEKENEDIYEYAKQLIRDYMNEGNITDPLGNKLYFAPGNTESIDDYTLHLIAGMGKGIEDIRVKRAIGLRLAKETIKNPLAILVENRDHERKVYVSVYTDGNSYTNTLIVGVEKDQEGRIVTCFMTAGIQRDKKAALRDIKKVFRTSKKVLYVRGLNNREGLSRHLRPSSETWTSKLNAKLHPFGNLSIAENKKESKKKERLAKEEEITELKRKLRSIQAGIQESQEIDIPVRELRRQARLSLYGKEIYKATSYKWWSQKADAEGRKASKALKQQKWKEASIAKHKQMRFSRFPYNLRCQSYIARFIIIFSSVALTGKRHLPDIGHCRTGICCRSNIPGVLWCVYGDSRYGNRDRWQ